MDFAVRIQQHVCALARRSPNHLVVGPFLIRFSPDWPSPYANYAIPEQDAEPTRRQIRELVAAFEQRERLPRLEYLPEWAPAVEPALLAAGFEVENRVPLLACTAADLVVPGPVPGLAVSVPENEDEFVALAQVQHRAYGEEGEPGDGELGWLRMTAHGGGAVALARVDGEPAGGGAASISAEGLSELAGIAVADRYRRRGVGAAVSAVLTATALDHQREAVWLEPAEESVERMYERIGYRRVTEKLNISLPRRR
ncbi:GNAT family N-acetyltransferase [Streptomyces tateyamensis]|uniref:GNAT family N-acetyltransferase n=1 Tax=Streptomyces tateyamensis TaxID=565073 RepID=A0A2V4N1D2_9ACTN|nr:GNAT family N-acetyltransferase [Streptomyces tateyamensis]PYC76279.1 GNAT family N-acetyltransferase [Streptomyces tateyamensis]